MKLVTCGLQVHLKIQPEPSPVATASPVKKSKKPPSQSAATQAIRRMCRKGKKGKAKVSEAVRKQFEDCGDGRKELVQLFIKCNGGHEACFEQVRLLIKCVTVAPGF